MENEKIPVCAYCRVSTEKESQLSSLNNQTFYFQEKTENSGKYTLYRIYADEGLSATSWKKRVCFKEMLIDAGLDIEIYRKEIKAYVSDRVPKFKRILIKDVSRFSRNASEGLELVTKLREKGVHIDFVSLGLSTEQMTNDMIIGFFLLAAENESKDKSQKVLWGKKIGAEKGVIHTTDNFYGYKYIKETNSLEIVEEEAEVIRKIYDLYVNEQYGFRKILHYLNEHKIYTRKGKPFVQQSVKRMLENPAYTGLLVRNKMDAPKVFTSKSYATIKPEEEWMITKDRIPQIIEPEMLRKSLEIRKSKINYKKRIGKYNGRSEYAGLIKCSICGANYTKNIEKSTGREFYNCSTKKNKGKKVCASVNVFLDQIEDLVNAYANGAIYDALIRDRDKSIKSYKEDILKIKNKMDKQSIEDVNRLKKELDVLYEENKRLAILFVKGSIKEEHLNVLQKELDEKIGILEREIEEKSKDNKQLELEIAHLEKVIREINHLEVKDKYSKDEVKEFLSCFVISRDMKKPNKAHIEAKFKIFAGLEEIVSGAEIFKNMGSAAAVEYHWRHNQD